MYENCRRTDLRRIPDNIKVTFLIHFNFYIPNSARVCDHHLVSNDWDQIIDSPNLLHDFNATHFVHIMSLMKIAVLRGSILDFDNIDDMDPNEVYIRLGVSRDQFMNILEQTPSLSNVSTRPKTSLACYLMKLRSGEANERLATLFNMSRRTLERHLTFARDSLLLDFVPRHLGYDHLNRIDVANRNLQVPNAIFGNANALNRKAIVIADATYIYIQKSANYLFQKRSYSLHKYTNLLKPFLIVCCDGHILDAFGPYSAIESDAQIMKNMIDDEGNPFHWFFEHGDVFILDRGFRDVIDDLHACGYEAHLPKTKNRDEDQLTTEQANKSRLVTMCRWVVEVINGWFKRDFKLFRQDFFNRALPHMMTDFRIGAALLNVCREPLSDNVHAETFIEVINQRVNQPNNLAEYVLANNLNRRRASFDSITGNQPNISDFPLLTEDDLTIFALGTYQVKLARSYYAEHVRQGLYNIETYRDPDVTGLGRCGITATNVWLLRCRIQSRHTRSKIYYSYIIVDREKSGREAIENYYCSCLSGKRTLGCCAHIMCVVWYLGWARNQEEDIRLPAHFLNDIIVDDN